MKKWAGLFFIFTPAIALASNFGDLPSVLPLFWLALAISFFVAIAMAMKPAKETKERKFKFITYFLYQFLGVVLSFVLIVVLWLGTL